MELSCTSAEMKSVYSAFSADWATRHSLGQPYLSAEMKSVYSAAQVDWASKHPGYDTKSDRLEFEEYS